MYYLFMILLIKIVKNLKNWLIDIKDNTMQDFIIILIANKSDLENNRIVTYNEGFKFTEENNLIFLETSAKDNIKMNDTFIL